MDEWARNAAGTRLVTQEFFGIACYVGQTTDGHFHGTHQGLVGTLDEAQRWLDADPTVQPLVVFTEADIEAIRSQG